MWSKRFNRRLLTAIALLVVCASIALGQTSAFTYQGKLTDGGNPANGNYDRQFKLFDTAAVGTGLQLGPTITNPSVPVTAGIFTVQLDFGAGAFSGPPRFLEIGVRLMGSPDPYTLLSPRQAMTSTPYSVRSLNSSVADVLSSACVGCVTSTQVGSVSGSSVTGTIPVASVPAGSGNYVQNTTSPQGSSNFNIDGNGTAGGTLSASTVTATSQFNIGVNRVLALGSSTGIFVGRLAGVSNTTGSGNTFVGDSAGRFNTTASNNSFFGRDAGTVNTANDNSFFGALSGDSNTTGTRNSFFGRTAGDANQTGNDNAFFGYTAGRVNTASFNSFFGSNAGNSTTSGANNTFFGYNAGQTNLTGANNAFFGYQAGLNNTANNNSFFGSGAGASNTTGDHNAFFGYLTGTSNTIGTENSFFGYAAGSSITSTSSNSFFGYNAGVVTTSGAGNSFFGDRSGDSNTFGDANAFFGWNSGSLNSTGSANVFIGNSAGDTNTTGSSNTAIGSGADVGLGNLSFATAIGAGAVVSFSNTIEIGRNLVTDTVRIPGNLHVFQDSTFSFATFGNSATFDNAANFNGSVFINSLGSSGSTDLCLTFSNRISGCSSSLRYKTNVQTFYGGLDIVRRLRPIAFSWKEGGMRDVGFGAEEVEKVEPLLTTRNSKGEIEGVKYGQLTTVLVNAVKEQQQIIEHQQRQLSEQQRQLEALKKLVCLSNPRADVCTAATGR